jgi:hypothetical protein
MLRGGFTDCSAAVFTCFFCGTAASCFASAGGTGPAAAAQPVKLCSRTPICFAGSITLVLTYAASVSVSKLSPMFKMHVFFFLFAQHLQTE